MTNKTELEKAINVDWAALFNNNKLEFWGVILFIFASALATAIRICRRNRHGHAALNPSNPTPAVTFRNK